MPACKLHEYQDFIRTSKTETWVEINRSKKNIQAKLRFIRYRINDNDYVLLTSLLDAEKFPRHAIRDLYHARWGIEEFFKTMKSEGKIEQFHAKTLKGIRQEIFAFLLLQSISRILTLKLRRKKSALRASSPSSSRSCRVQLNQKHTITLFVWLSPRLLAKNVHDEDIENFLLLVTSGLYTSYGGRTFERVSYKPSPKWRKSRKKG